MARKDEPLSKVLKRHAAKIAAKKRAKVAQAEGSELKHVAELEAKQAEAVKTKAAPGAARGKEWVNKKGATVRELAVPMHGHKFEVVCVQCGKTRPVHGGDAWQVTLCVTCRDAQKDAQKKERLPKVMALAKAKAEQETERFYIPKLQVLHYIWKDADSDKKIPVKRIWP